MKRTIGVAEPPPQDMVDDPYVSIRRSELDRLIGPCPHIGEAKRWCHFCDDIGIAVFFAGDRDDSAMPTHCPGTASAEVGNGMGYIGKVRERGLRSFRFDLASDLLHEGVGTRLRFFDQLHRRRPGGDVTVAQVSGDVVAISERSLPSEVADGDHIGFATDEGDKT